MARGRPLHVRILRPLAREPYSSMLRYADGIAAQMRRLPDLVTVQEIQPSPLAMPARYGWVSEVDRFLTKYVAYQLKVLGGRGAGVVNHVVDHAYGHLVHSLDARRTVVTVHDLTPLHLRRGRWGRSLRFRLWSWVGFLYSLKALLRAGIVVTDSNAIREELIIETGVDPARVRAIPPGISESFHPLSEASVCRLRDRYEISRDVRVVLHVGGSEPRKNLERLITAFAEVKRQRRGQTLLLKVGSDFTAVQWQLIRRCSLEGWVRSTGPVGAAELVGLYNLADVVAFPSSYEGFGWPPLEAMKCGTPAIVGDCPALREVVDGAAPLVDPENPRALAEAMLGVLEDRGYRERLVEQGFDRAKAFTWDETARCLTATYRELLA